MKERMIRAKRGRGEDLGVRIFQAFASEHLRSVVESEETNEFRY